MSKLFKSKILLGLVIVAALVVGVAAVKAEAQTSCTLSTTLRQGSTGAEVMCLQTKLGLTADGKFGPMTAAAVKAFQASKGLTADGIVGAMTRAALTGSVVVNPGTNLPAGCTSTAGYSPINGAKCDGGSTPSTDNNGPLEGGAGDIDVTKTSTDVEDEVKEGDEDVSVLGFEVEADGSDVELTSVRVVLSNNSDSDSTSQRLEDYLDKVSVMYGDEEVGSADVEDFNRERNGATVGSDEYTETIQLDGAVVREGDEEKLYVAVSAASSIDESDQAADWDIALDTVRFTDSTGVVLSYDASSVDDTFGFDDSSADDDLTVKSSSSNPDAKTVKVDENDTSDEVLALVYKLEVDEDSSDITVYDLPVDITLDNYGTSATTVDDIIDEVTVEVDGDKFEADLTDTNSNDASAASNDLDDDGTTAVVAAYNLDLEDGDVVIGAGDTVEVKVYITFNEQENNYALNTTIAAALDASDIEAEGEDGDRLTGITGDRSGGTLTLDTSAATISSVSWQTGGGSTAGNIDFFFTVEAEDEDFDVLLSSITANDTTAGTATIAAPVLSKVSGDATENTAGSDYTVTEGDTARFRVRYAVTGTSGQSAEVTIESVAGQEIDEDDQLSPTLYLQD